MGLDMYAYSTQQVIPPVDFEMPQDAQKIAQWRKHPNLHGWMHTLYLHKGGADEQFNCSQVELTLYELDALEEAVRAQDLPDTCGFFFGESQPEDQADDLAFIAAARRAIAAGNRIFYTAWW